MSNKPITVADVARLAQVSKATAARVLGGYGVTSDKTRAAVTDAARALGYHSNELARSMSTGRSGLVGVVVGDIENAFFSQAVRGISDRAKALGLNVVITNSGEDIAQEREAVELLLRQRVAGLIVAPTDAHQTAHLAGAIRAGTPVVTLDRHIEGLAVDSICGDDTGATRAVMHHLHQLGHRDIVYVTALARPVSGPVTRESLAGISITAVRRRIEAFWDAAPQVAGENVIWGAGASNGAEIIDRLLARRPEVSAILASDSLVGAALYGALLARGVALPQDMSFVSWFDADWTRVTRPQITVVDQPTYRFGTQAMSALAQRLAGETAPARQIILPTRILHRGSVGASAR